MMLISKSEGILSAQYYNNQAAPTKSLQKTLIGPNHNLERHYCSLKNPNPIKQWLNSTLDLPKDMNRCTIRYMLGWRRGATPAK